MKATKIFQMNFQLTNEEVKAQERNLNTTSKQQKQDS